MHTHAPDSPRIDRGAARAIPRPEGHRRAALLAGAIGGILVLLVPLVWAWHTVDPILSEVDRLQQRKLPRVYLIQRARYADLEASIALRNALMIQDLTLSAAELQRFDTQRQVAAVALASLRQSMVGPDGSARLQAALAARENLEAVRLRAAERERLSWHGTSKAGPVPDTAATDLQVALDGYLRPLQVMNDHEEQRISSIVTATREQADRVWWLLMVSGSIAAVTLLTVTVGWRVELRREVDKRDRTIRSLDEQRQALVREVHHRIKNHLQGLLGLIEMRRSAPTGDDPALATLHGHVLALMSIHGLQSRQSDQVSLLDLVRQQIRLVQTGFPSAQLALTGGQGIEAATLDAEQAVPVALVTGELMVNAIKHGAPAPIAIDVARVNGTSCIRVTNRMAAGHGFDLSSQRGLGTGLSLVESLLQGIGRVRQTLNDAELTMTMELGDQVP